MPTEAGGPIEIKILRTFEEVGRCSSGEIRVADKFVTHELELPWKNDRSYISSIPGGVYTGVLQSFAADQWRLSVSVPNRPGTQLHLGNCPLGSEGCVSIGRSLTNTSCKISDSVAAAQDLPGRPGRSDSTDPSGPNSH
jgi:hypothetical protein